jgi:hypothetical protein
MRWLPRDPYTIAAIALFVVLVTWCWSGFVENDEELYFLGSRRIADPALLALDLTWSKLPPTSWLFDHLLAPLWSVFNDFVVANLGRLLFWILSAWSITFLARTIRLPAWCAVVGVAVWLSWGQSLGICGSVFEGFQPKSLAYPLMFFALAMVMRGQPLWAGLAAGLATAFHIIVGGWACLALFLSMLVNRKLVPIRQVGSYLVGTAPFVVPVVASVALFHGVSLSAAEQAQINQIYALFAMPHCCDASYFMVHHRPPRAWAHVAVTFAIAPIAILAWSEQRAARILGGFIVATIVFFAAGMLALKLQLYGLLTLYPFQLANSLPAMFLFMFVPGWIAARSAIHRWGWIVGIIVLAGTLWLAIDRGVPRALVEEPLLFLAEAETYVMVGPAGETLDSLYTWIREDTPRNSVFITPFIVDFWPYGERAQVASMRHPPLDRRIIDWKQRLEALNGSQPFRKRGFETAEELEAHEGRLSIPELLQIRERYGATHYLMKGSRPDLAPWLLHSGDGYSVYDVAAMNGGVERSAPGGH